VALDAGGIGSTVDWLLTPPPATWHREQADRTAVLLQTYDRHIHDFDGQALGLLISGGRNTSTEPPAILAEERIKELNPVWSAEKIAAIIDELDAGLTDLFPHAEQRGFPLSWVYVPSLKELTHDRFAKGSSYFYKFGGEVYRLASILDTKEKRGHKASGGTLHLSDILNKLFSDLENSYLLHLRIPNPAQKRTERRLRLKVEGAVVRTQEFYRPSESLIANIERYIASASKERRFRAAYAAREYPLNGRIYRKLTSWMPHEPSSQVLPMLEESRLLMEFKRAQAADGSIRTRACEYILGLDESDLAQENRSLASRLRELATGTCIGDVHQIGVSGTP
jgi:hypothetical protein